MSTMRLIWIPKQPTGERITVAERAVLERLCEVGVSPCDEEVKNMQE